MKIDNVAVKSSLKQINIKYKKTSDEMVWGGGFPGQRRRLPNSRRSTDVPYSEHSAAATSNHHQGSVLQNSNSTNQIIDVSNAAINAEEAEFLRQAQALIPAEVRMISGCEDEQTSC